MVVLSLLVNYKQNNQLFGGDQSFGCSWRDESFGLSQLTDEWKLWP